MREGLQQREGAFELHTYPDESRAREAIEDREVYGAVAVTPSGPKLLTASAAGPVVAQALEQAAARMAPDGGQVRTDDVVAAPPEDPRGAVLSASVLPLAIAGVAGGAVVALLRLRGTRGVGVLLGVSALVGAVGAGITHSWLGVLTGNWWAEAGAIGLTALAVSATVAGLEALVGTAGIGIGGLIAVLLGNPTSGTTSAPEMLPEPLGTLGQLLPPGAGGTLLRSVAYFDGRAADTPVLVLTVWAVLGLMAVTVGGLRRSRAGAADTPGSRPVTTAPPVNAAS